jgi:hypothetical protein
VLLLLLLFMVHAKAFIVECVRVSHEAHCLHNWFSSVAGTAVVLYQQVLIIVMCAVCCACKCLLLFQCGGAVYLQTASTLTNCSFLRNQIDR